MMRPMASFCKVPSTRLPTPQRRLRLNKSNNLSDNAYNLAHSREAIKLIRLENNMNMQELSALFRKLGARNPEAWAHSQLEENIPQLARFLFLRQAWKFVITENDSEWISEMRQIDSNKPGGDIGPAITRLLCGGAQENDLTTVVRVMQWQILSRMCQLLDDPGNIEREAGDIAWQLFQVDENDHPISIIGGLVESVLETDPTGREMRPTREIRPT